MRAVILAAGMSTRLRPLTSDRPKCLLTVGGVPILRRAISVLRGAGVDELVMVTGYLEDKIRAAVADWFPDLPVRYRRNDEFDRTQNGASLLCAREVVEGEEFLLLDGDIVFEAGVVESLLAAPYADSLALRPADDLGHEEVKVILDGETRVRRIHVTLPPEEAAGESIGVERFSAASSRRIFPALEARIREHGPKLEYYEKTFDELCQRGELELHAVDVGRWYCSEIDTIDDLQAVERALAARGIA